MPNVTLIRPTCFVASLLAFGAASGFAATPTVFATCPQLFTVNGLAATQSKLLFTTQNQPNLYQIDSSGTVCTLFAVLPAPSGPQVPVVEQYIAVSPGLPGFPAGTIYVTLKSPKLRAHSQRELAGR